MGTGKIIRRIAIRSLKNTDQYRSRVMDILIGEKDVYLEIRTGKSKGEVISLKDVVKQIRIAAAPQQTTTANAPPG